MPRFVLLVVTLALGALLGWLSARVMLDRAVMASGQNVAGWQEIRNSTGAFETTYQSGYYLTRGQLPPPQHVRQFIRSRDDAGNTLRTDCATRVEGFSLPGRWWQISASTEQDTRAISSGGIIREAGGTFIVTLWNAVSPGNWLPLGEAEDYELRLFVHEPSTEDGQAITLPTVQRLWC